MIKIHFVGGENLVVEVADTDGFRRALENPEGLIEVTHDGKSVLVRVQAIAAVVFIG
ncbi:MAG TPA: hypothetical protein VMW08_02710 [Acidimicrobiales bacterium]|nr:hypothetical protein [Acidimicrobiales bacterium]